MINIAVFIAALASYALFLARFAWNVIVWFRSPNGDSTMLSERMRKSSLPCISTLLDILFFRRIFRSSKSLWPGSWIFHLAFVFVLLRHLKFIFPSLPDCLIALQPLGLVAGYLLPFSLLYIIALRSVRKKERYTSFYNYGIAVMLFLVSTSGLIMRLFFRVDQSSVKYFSLGIVTLRPHAIPDNPLFLFHILTVMLLLPNLPLHLIAAPFVLFNANRREEELRYMIHEE